MSTLSELQHKILVELAKNPFAKRSDFTKALGRTVSSLNQAIPALKRSGALSEGLVVNADWNPLQKFFIFVETKPADKSKPTYQREFVEKVESLLKKDEWYRTHLFLEDIEIVMGADWDIILVVRSNKFINIAKFVTEYLRLQPEVSGTRTSQVLLKENRDVAERRLDNE